MKIITSLTQLRNIKASLDTLANAGLTASDDALALGEYKVELDYKTIEKETQGTWRWVSFGHEATKKNEFYNQLDILQRDGHCCFLPPLLNDRNYQQVRISTDLSDEVLKSLFEQFIDGTLIIAVMKKSL